MKMNQLRYAARYFGGPSLQPYNRNLLEGGLKVFNEQYDGLAPLVCETGIDGVLIDFNSGLRLQIPEGNWHVRIADARSELIFLDEDVERVTLISMEKFYIEWEIALWLDGEPVFFHQFDPTGQRVHFRFTRNAIGDNIALLPYVEEFRRVFDSEVSISIGAHMRDIVRNYFPRVRLIEGELDEMYATFYMSGWMNMPLATTSDVRSIPMEDFGRTLLNTPRIQRAPKVIYKPTKPREIEGKYVCIGVHASANPKCWLNPGGWDQVVDYLKSIGYRVLCIDRDRSRTDHDMTVEMPEGAEDFSGSYDLIDRVNQLAYADFFIGLGSGLSWLAWAVDIPVVLISGISEPWCEFESAYRVNNPLVCHGCYNDLRVNCLAISECIHYQGAPERRYECSKEISARQVIAA
ncbi:MAG: autotransporter strand-loop-strand O-heptosyltransferase, partial [Selenomonadaceae bacterium]|nr:autotransporter strand-loop-strand O-heptosyltransferase [Selenomonadaceae bacterium]